MLYEILMTLSEKYLRNSFYPTISDVIQQLMLLLFNKELRKTLITPIKRFLSFSLPHTSKRCRRPSTLKIQLDRETSSPTNTTDT
uniref:Uncharacterized protein n=1 Tax=Parascaris equorum TaxID=6256 RepID=A0A914RK38_PAREQ